MRGTQSLDLDPLPCVRGPKDKKKVLHDRSKSTHSGRNTQRNFDPPPSPKNGYSDTGGRGSKSKNSSGDYFLSQNDDCTRGCYTSDPMFWGMLRERPLKKGGGLVQGLGI